MNAVGIDVSKGKSTVAVLRPFGEVAASPFDVIHNDSDLKQLVELIKALPGESKVVMEYTGTYFEPIAQFLHNNGIFVSVVNALLVHDLIIHKSSHQKQPVLPKLETYSQACRLHKDHLFHWQSDIPCFPSSRVQPADSLHR